MAVLNAQAGNSVLNNNQSVAFLGNGLPHGNPSNTLHLTSSATKINENAVLNRPNNMVSGNSRNTIHGIKNNVLQGAQPETKLLADAFNKDKDKSKGTVPAHGIATINGVADNECKSPRKSPANVWRNGSWVPSVGNVFKGAGCGCYESTGLNAFNLFLTIGLAGLGRLGFVANKIRNAKKARMKLERRYQALLKEGREAYEDAKKQAWLLQNPGQKYYAAPASSDFLDYREVLKNSQAELKNFDELIKTADTIREGSKEAAIIDKMMFNEAVFGGGSYVAIAALANQVGSVYDLFTLYRDKNCKGDNTELNEETCNCDCILDDAGSQSFTTQSSEICYSPGAISYFDQALEILVNEIPGFNNLLSGEEVEGCYLPCECAESQKTDAFGNELCGCLCNEYEFGFTDNLRSVYGRHPDAATDCPFETSLNTNTCCCECPDGSDVKEGRTKPTLARLSDNLSDPSVGSTGHYLYETGCNFVCDGRDYVGTWPPTCPQGECFDSTADVCKCVPASTPVACPMPCEWYNDNGEWLSQLTCEDIDENEYLGCSCQPPIISGTHGDVTTTPCNRMVC